MTRLTPYLLAAPAALLRLGLLAGPLALRGRVSLYAPAAGRGFYRPNTWTGENFAAVLDGYGLRLAGFTVLFAAGVAAAGVLAAYPLALAIHRLPARWRRPAVAIVLLPKLVGPLVTLFGLAHLLADAPVPLTRTLAGALAGEATLVVPYLTLVLVVHLGRLDPALEAAARGLGASPWQAFRRVTLPLSVPGLVLAGRLGLVWGLGAFLGPLLLGGPDQTTLSVEAHRQAFEYGRWPRAAAEAVVLLATAGVCLGVTGRLARRGAA